jgi:hypothetical protein
MIELARGRRHNCLGSLDKPSILSIQQADKTRTLWSEGAITPVGLSVSLTSENLTEVVESAALKV